MEKLNNRLRQRSQTASGATGAIPAVLHALADSWAALRATSRGDSERSGQAATGFVAVLFVILLAVIESFVDPRVSFSLFYLLVVTYAAWFGGRKAGVVVAFASSLALFLHEARVSDDSAPGWPLYWNLWMQIGIYLFAAFLVSAVRSLKETLAHRVRERTSELEREIVDRKQTEAQLVKTLQQLRQLAENIADAFWMRNGEDTRMIYVSPAYEKIWGRNSRELYHSAGGWLAAIHPEDRERVAHAIETKQATGEYNEEYRIVRPDSSLRRIRDRAFPIRDGAGRVIRIVGIAEDITDQRRMEREILEISDREQARIGQDLHDSLCQKLVSLAFDNESLEQKLAARSVPETDAARQMGELLDDVITEARALSRGLFPVKLEADGFGIALRQLAASVSARFKVDCRAHCDQPAPMASYAAAMHLYRIAQEAVNNAIKHAQGGVIAIELRSIGDRIELSVSDDGIGLSPVKNPNGGMGLHIMEYRARTIGGTLSVGRRPGGGTIVTCVVHPAQTEKGEHAGTRAN
jgi:PAS domain S-box-containing protein